MSDASDQLNASKYNCLLFDMDDTLYPLSSGLNLACRKNIQDYMLHHLGIEESEVSKLCLDLYKEYGTTMAGLKVLGYEFDNDEFHDYVHRNLPYECLKPDPVLRALLLSMPQRKIIFTNADKAHASRVITRLGLEDCFEGIICFERLNPTPICQPTPNSVAVAVCHGEVAIDATPAHQQISTILCKPSLEAMEAAIKIANIDPTKTLFFDDSTRNIAAAKTAGLHTVIVGSSELVTGADHALISIHNVKEAIKEIWEGQGDQNEAATISSATASATVVETTVLA